MSTELAYRLEKQRVKCLDLTLQSDAGGDYPVVRASRASRSAENLGALLSAVAEGGRALRRLDALEEGPASDSSDSDDGLELQSTMNSERNAQVRPARGVRFAESMFLEEAIGPMSSTIAPSSEVELLTLKGLAGQNQASQLDAPKPPARSTRVAFSEARSVIEIADGGRESWNSRASSSNGSPRSTWWSRGRSTFRPTFGRTSTVSRLSAMFNAEWPAAWRSRQSSSDWTLQKVRTLQRTFAEVGKQQGAKAWQSLQVGKLRRVIAGTSTGAALLIAVLNAIVARVPWLQGIFRPHWPVGTPFILFAVAMLISFFGCKSTTGHTGSSEPPFGGLYGLDVIWSLKAIIKPGGDYFHAKASTLKTLQILNMALRLWEYVFTGQTASLIYFQASLVLANGLFSPYLLLSDQPEFHTIGLLMFDVFLDTTYGSIMPISMVTWEIAPVILTYFWYPAVFEHDFHRSPAPTQGQWRAANLFARSVPQNWSQLFSVVWPFISATLRMRDILYAAQLYPTGDLEVEVQYPCRKQLGAIFASFALAAFLAAVYMTTRPTCRSMVAWHQACLLETRQFSRSCGCVYIKLNGTHAGSSPVDSPFSTFSLPEMLKESGDKLELLVVDDVHEASLADFPSLNANPGLIWFFSHGGIVERLPNLNKNVNLERLVFKDHRLREIPDLSSNAKLMWLDVTGNQVSEVPDLKGCPRLERLMLSSNRIARLPRLDHNLALRKLRAYDNNLTIEGFPALRTNSRLSVLDLTSNLMSSLPDLSRNLRLSELRVADNLLSTLPDLRRNTVLLEVDIAGNRFRHWPDLSGNVNIWFLDASHNFFSAANTTPWRLNRLWNLSVVDLCHARRHPGDFERAHVEEDVPGSPHYRIEISGQSPLAVCQASASRCSCCHTSTFHVTGDLSPIESSWYFHVIAFAFCFWCSFWLMLFVRMNFLKDSRAHRLGALWSQRRSLMAIAFFGGCALLYLLWWARPQHVGSACP